MASPNQRISEYVLDELIGGGTFGEVWKAHHHVWVDQLVAIKLPSESQYIRTLQSEGVVIHGLVHPNIVRAIGFDPYSDPAYLVMEYVPGTSLRPLIQQRKLSVDDSVAVMRQILAGLAFAHSKGMIHRDVKPENILIHERAARDGLSSEGVVKITDFGLGKAAASAVVGSIAMSVSMNTPAGRDIAGTLDYMAPEQRSGAAPDARADLYSCGVILYELLTGERPAGTECPSDLNPKVPKSLDEAFKRSYARLEKRFTSADEFAKALNIASPPPLPARGGGAGFAAGGAGFAAGAAGFASGGGGFAAGGVAGVANVAGGPGIAGAVAGRMPSTPFPPRLSGVAPMAPSTHSFGARTSCTACRQPVDPNDQFCIHCGVQLVEKVRRCTKCGAFPDRTDRYCIFCGETLQPELARV
jgi:serine/threonine protein kinase